MTDYLTGQSYPSLNAYPDYYIFIDINDSNIIKARNQKTGVIDSSHATNADVVLQSCLNALSSGGTIFIGVGTFNNFLLVSTANAVNIIGSGRGNTILKRQIPTNTPQVRLTGANSSILNLTLDGNYPTNTSSTTNGELETNAANILCNSLEVKNFKARGIVNGGHTRISDSVITGVLPGTNASISQFGVLPYPLNTPPITWIERCNIQYCSLNAIYGSNVTIMKDCYFANNAFAAGGQVGSQSDSERTIVQRCIVHRGLGGDDGIECQWGDWIVTGNHVYNQTGFGILIHNTTPPTRNVVIANNIVRNCDFLGIGVIEAVSHFIITGNISYDDRVTPLQGQGIRIYPVACDHYIVKNNICYGNTVAQIEDLGTGTDKIVKDNIGHDPAAVSTITPGASPYTYTNNDGFPQVVTITGGTVSSIQYKRGATAITLGITTGQIVLQPNDITIVTYSSVPTMRKFPF